MSKAIKDNAMSKIGKLDEKENRDFLKEIGILKNISKKLKGGV